MKKGKKRKGAGKKDDEAEEESSDNSAEVARAPKELWCKDMAKLTKMGKDKNLPGKLCKFFFSKHGCKKADCAFSHATAPE